jgi:hypothetical protein
MNVHEAARQRETEASDQRYKHGKAGRIWDSIAAEEPSRAVSLILAKWMYAYEAADAEAERAFREIAAREPA